MDKEYLKEAARAVHDRADAINALFVGWTKTERILDECRKHAEELEREISVLNQWKSEAMEVLGKWEAVWIAAGSPGRPGQSKSEVVKIFILENDLGDARRADAEPNQTASTASPRSAC